MEPYMDKRRVVYSDQELRVSSDSKPWWVRSLSLFNIHMFIHKNTYLHTHTRNGLCPQKTFTAQHATREWKCAGNENISSSRVFRFFLSRRPIQIQYKIQT